MSKITHALFYATLVATPPSADCAKELPATRAIFEKLKSTSTTSLTSKGLFKNTAGKLILKFQNGKNVTFKDFANPEDETAVKTHNYLGFSQALNRFLVQLKYYEHSEVLLISKECEVDTLWEIPYVSADGKMAISLSRGIEYEVYNNGFQVSTINSKGFFKICDKKIISYEPMALRWSSNKSFILETVNPLVKTRKAVYKRYSL